MEYASIVTSSVTTTREFEFVGTEEGRLISSNSVFTYEYTIADHLGNARVTFKGQSSPQYSTERGAFMVFHYYPFGLVMDGDGMSGITTDPTNNYQYNGKELQPETGWNDYGARMYDASICRWMVSDPLSEISISESPFTYALNNPIYFTDPFGLTATPPDWVDETNPGGTSKIVWVDDVTRIDDPNLKSNQKYLGKQGRFIEPNGDRILYHSDGTTSTYFLGLNGVTVKPEQTYTTNNQSLSDYNQTNYIWDESDLRGYNNLYALRNTTTPIHRGINKQIREGKFKPLSGENYYDRYGSQNGAMLMFLQFYIMIDDVGGFGGTAPKMHKVARNPKFNKIQLKPAKRLKFQEWYKKKSFRYKGGKGKRSGLKKGWIDFHRNILKTDGYTNPHTGEKVNRLNDAFLERINERY